MRWGWRIALVLLGLGALWLRTRHLDVALDESEAWFYALARTLGTGMGRFSPDPPALGHLLERPLFFLAYFPAASLGGLAACRLMAAVVSAALAPALVVLARRLGVSGPIALAGGLLLAVEEIGTRVGGQLFPGPLAALLAFVGLALVGEPKRRWLGFVLLGAAPLVDRLFLLAPLAGVLHVWRQPDDEPLGWRPVLGVLPALALAALAVVADAPPEPLWTVPPLGARVLAAGFVDPVFVPLLLLAAVLGPTLLLVGTGPALLLVARFLVADRGAEVWQSASLVPGGLLLWTAALQALLVEPFRRGRALVAAAFAVAFAVVIAIHEVPTAADGLPLRVSLTWARARVTGDVARPVYAWALRQKPAYLLVAGCPWSLAFHLGRRAERVEWRPQVQSYELESGADAVIFCDLPLERAPGQGRCQWRRGGRYLYVAPGECR